MRFALAIAVGLVSGFGAFAAMRWLPGTIRTRMTPFDVLLAQAGVEPGDHLRARLESQAARRHIWGAVGAGVGYGSTLTGSLLLDSTVLNGANGLVAVVGFWFGSAVGQSLSALFPVNRPQGRVLVTAMQPHGMTEYLHRREIIAEVCLVAFGWVTALVGILVLTNLADMPAIGRTAPSMVVVGSVVAFVATTTVLVQRRLLAAPLRADDQEGLVKADTVLALGLRDLLAVTMSATATAAWMTLLLPGSAWWLVATFALVAIVALGVTLAVRTRPNLLPLAHRLAVRGRTA